MPRYRFAVKDEWGRRKTGGIDAPDLEGARKRLLQGGFEVLSLVEDGQPLREEELATPRKAPPKLLIYVGMALFALGGMVGLASWLRKPTPAPKPQRKAAISSRLMPKHLVRSHPLARRTLGDRDLVRVHVGREFLPAGHRVPIAAGSREVEPLVGRDPVRIDLAPIGIG